MIVVDSSVWIDNLRDADTGQVALLRRLTVGQIIVGDLIVLEVQRGMDSERGAAAQERRFRAIGITPLSDPEIAVAAAANYRRLRAHGITVRSIIDAIIATYCIEHNHQLLHDDRDFDHFERHLGLQVRRP
jgi:predicted nucleic acid-binding protein